MLKNKNSNNHFLIIGFTNSKYHIDYALKNKIKISLLISKNKYKPEYRQFFESTYVVDDIFDFDQVKNTIANKKITAILTRFEDYISVVGALNEHLGLDGIDYQTSRNFGNKYQMKKKWLESLVPCAEGICVDDTKNIEPFLKKNPFPLILKKTSGTHSSFVFKVKSKSDLQEKLSLFNSLGSSYKISKPLKNFKETKKECNLLLETMLHGIEVTIDTFVSSGVFTHTPICQYILPEELGINDSYLPIRIIPTDLSDQVKSKILTTTELALKALGAKNCVCHTEIFYDLKKDQCWVIETTPRGGGNRSRMVNHTTNNNYDEAIFKATNGEKINDFLTNGKTFAVVEYFAEQEGFIKEINLDFLDKIPSAKLIKNRYKKGDKVKPGYIGGKNIAVVSLEGNDASTMRKASINLFKKIRAGIIVENKKIQA